MSLLKYETSYDKTSVIGTEEYKFKVWTARNEREYLQLLERDANTITDKTIFDILLAPCLENKDVVLSASAQKKLLIDIRKESISEDIIDKHTCTECGLETDINIKIDDIIKYKESSFQDISIDGIRFIMGPIRTNKEKDKLKLEEGIVNYIFNDFLLHIHAIEIDGVIEDKFNWKELNKFIDSLPTKIFDKVFETYQDMIDTLELEYDFECSCSHKEKIDYTQIPNFLWA